MFRSNNEIVDQMLEISITGNVVPQIWFKTLVDEKDRPQLLAIIILADIVYWYRPVEVRDEQTGKLVGYKKKFKGDLLQRGYAQIEEQFGVKTPAIRAALRFLEEKKVVRRVFRTITVQGQTLSNVLYLELCVDGLKKVTYPEMEDITDTPSYKILQEGVQDFVTPVEKTDSTLLQNFTTGIEKNNGTNTEITTETTTEITNLSINQESFVTEVPEDRWMELVSEPVILDPKEEVSEETSSSIRAELSANQGIPYEAAFDMSKMKKTIQTLCYWNDHEIICNGDTLLMEAYRQVIAALIEMATERKLCQYSGSIVSYKHVIDQINIIYRKDPGVNGMLFFAERTAEKVKSVLSDKRINHPEKYIKTLIWNNFRSYQVEWENYFLQSQNEAYNKSAAE